MPKKLSLYSGMIIPLWLFIGVTIAGLMNPGYSHVNQAMSELGVKGSTTHFISPLINNFPLGILFIAFGLYLISTLKHSKLAITSGATRELWSVSYLVGRFILYASAASEGK